jgi:hypothetical protein
MPFVKNIVSYSRVSSLVQVENATTCLGKFYHHLYGLNAENLTVTLPNFHNENIIIIKF